ncbi:hypothetical protein B0O99DRAFT_602043 [Bisporella sp. PMI_857]|nr:hypothetical protein B0O99DRAFT_602043 [Bisporella sp. PMI_857]
MSDPIVDTIIKAAKSVLRGTPNFTILAIDTSFLVIEAIAGRKIGDGFAAGVLNGVRGAGASVGAGAGAGMALEVAIITRTTNSTASNTTTISSNRITIARTTTTTTTISSSRITITGFKKFNNIFWVESEIPQFRTQSTSKADTDSIFGPPN